LGGVDLVGLAGEAACDHCGGAAGIDVCLDSVDEIAIDEGDVFEEALGAGDVVRAEGVHDRAAEHGAEEGCGDREEEAVDGCAGGDSNRGEQDIWQDEEECCFGAPPECCGGQRQGLGSS
jgi:hypothetical protein